MVRITVEDLRRVVWVSHQALVSLVVEHVRGRGRTPTTDHLDRLLALYPALGGAEVNVIGASGCLVRPSTHHALLTDLVIGLEDDHRLDAVACVPVGISGNERNGFVRRLYQRQRSHNQRSTRLELRERGFVGIGCSDY